MDLDFIADILAGAGAMADGRGYNALAMGAKASALALRFVDAHQKAGTRDPVDKLERILASDDIVTRVRTAADEAEDRKFGKST